ncbi:MAG: molybdenum cofactor guanylyltransferase MobA [Xanthobacteraceae bacterium]|nr:molybdenum cofactor guanylyltransferase MobA [Xanthobacteraceae bacterium]
MTYPATPGVLLAGGLARRMGGGDKPMQLIGGRSILDRTINRIMPQCEHLVLNANGDPARFESFRLPIVCDTVEGFAGPLAGILSGLDWVAVHRPQAKWVLSAPGDCPFLPHDLVQRLHGGRDREKHSVVIAESGGRIHPVIALWDVGLRHQLRHALTVDNVRKVSDWAARFEPAVVSWPTEPFDPFFNINTPDDLAEAERLAALLDPR